jgi:hypothetical protein
VAYNIKSTVSMDEGHVLHLDSGVTVGVFFMSCFCRFLVILSCACVAFILFIFCVHSSNLHMDL